MRCKCCWWNDESECDIVTQIHSDRHELSLWLGSVVSIQGLLAIEYESQSLQNQSQLNVSLP